MKRENRRAREPGGPSCGGRLVGLVEDLEASLARIEGAGDRAQALAELRVTRRLVGCLLPAVWTLLDRAEPPAEPRRTL